MDLQTFNNTTNSFIFRDETVKDTVFTKQEVIDRIRKVLIEILRDELTSDDKLYDIIRDHIKRYSIYDHCEYKANQLLKEMGLIKE